MLNRLKRILKDIKEDGGPCNVVGTGAIAGAGVGIQGEPGKSKKNDPVLATVKRKLPKRK